MSEVWAAIEAISTAVVAVFTPVTIGVSAYYLHRTLRTTAIQSVSDQVLILGRWLAEHDNYRQALKLDETTDNPDGEAAGTVYADFIDHVLSLEDIYDPQYMKGWEKYFKDRLNEYPQIRKFVRAHRDWYGPKLNALLPETS